jgi:hypothetical protein
MSALKVIFVYIRTVPKVVKIKKSPFIIICAQRYVTKFEVKIKSPKNGNAIFHSKTKESVTLCKV